MRILNVIIKAIVCAALHLVIHQRGRISVSQKKSSYKKEARRTGTSQHSTQTKEACHPFGFHFPTGKILCIPSIIFNVGCYLCLKGILHSTTKSRCASIQGSLALH